MHYLIMPSMLVICATIGAAVIAITDALSKILFADDKLSEIISDIAELERSITGKCHA